MANQPNILLFFTDQQRGDTIGALGNPVIKTPNLDRICAEGVAFTSAYSPSPVCVPARCSTLYGQYPFNSGCYENRFKMPGDDKASLPGALAREGYRTHGIGKCHFRPDPHALRGFQTRERQEEIIGNPKDDEYLTYLLENGFDYVSDHHGVRGEMYYIPQVSQLPAEFHPTQWIGDRSIEFIKQQKKEPWFLFSSYVHPHPPFSPPTPWNKLYRAPLMPLPKVPQDVESLHTYINRHQNRYKYRDQGIDQNLLRCLKAHYYASISFIDYQIGRILDALEETGQLDNTLILYTSDHGEHLGDYNCFGKRSMHDTASRVPLLVRFPERFSGGQICNSPSSLVDVAPTALSVAKTTFRTHESDGVDLAELAAGYTSREYVISQHDKGNRATYMVVNDRWKYVYSAPDDKEFLFDRITDPEETRNRAGIPFVNSQMGEMRGLLIEQLKRSGEKEALDGSSWKKYPALNVPENPDANLLIQDQGWSKKRIPGYSD